MAADPSRDQPRRSVERPPASVSTPLASNTRASDGSATRGSPSIIVRRTSLRDGADERVERTRLDRREHRQIRRRADLDAAAVARAAASCAAPAPTVRASAFGAQLPRRMRGLQFIEQIAARRSIANRCPSASRSASSNARTSAVASNRNWFDEGHHTRPAPASITRSAAARQNATPWMKTVFARQAAERDRTCRARRAPRRPGPRRRESSTANRTASGDATAATASPSMCSEWLKPNCSTTRTGKRRRSDAMHRVVMADRGHARRAGSSGRRPRRDRRACPACVTASAGSLSNRGWKSAIHSLAFAYCSRHFNRGCELSSR